MKKILYTTSLFFLFTTALLCSCIKKSTHKVILEECETLYKKKIDSLNLTIKNLNLQIADLTDSVRLLSFPPNQRYIEIVQLIKNDSLDVALNKIEELKQLFPNSSEANNISEQIATINKKLEEKKAEENKRQALKFKIFKDKMNVTVKNNQDNDLKCSFSGFHFGKQFSYDYVKDVDEYYFSTANKNSTYLLANLSLSTDAYYAEPPYIYVCTINDGKLSYLTFFAHRYESWETYGAYIGNYSETSHDFSKVNTVKYKIAAQINLKYTKSPLVIILYKKGRKLTICDLDIEEVYKNCEVVKIINREKL